MKKGYILGWIILITLALTGCSSNTQPSNTQSIEQKQQKISQSQDIKKNKTNKQDIQDNKKTEIRFTLYKDEPCGKLCKKVDIKNILKETKVTIKSIKEPFKGIANAYPVLETDSLDGVVQFLKELTHQNVSKDQLSPQILKQMGIETVNNKYYIHLGIEAIWKENYCNNWKDDDNDGLVDSKDPDCSKMIVYYDSATKNKKSAKVWTKQAVSEYLQTVFPIGINYTFKDYEKDKQLYINLLKETKRSIYLPVFLLDKIPEWYYSIYLDQIKKQFPKFNIKVDWIDINYAKFLDQGWDPIKKKVKIKTFAQTGKLTKQELDRFNKDMILINPSSDVVLVIWTAGLCPYCKKFFNDLYQSGNINKLGGIIVQEFPLSQLHWKQDNNIAVFNKCVSKYIKDDKTKLKIIEQEYNKPSNDIKYYFGLIANNKELTNIKECYWKEFNKLLEEIKKENQSDANRFKIQGTPYIILYDKKTWVYGSIPGFIPTDMFDVAINNLKDLIKENR